MPQRLLPPRGALEDVRKNKREHQRSPINVSYRETLARKIHAKDLMTSSTSSILRRLDEKDNQCIRCQQSGKSNSCDQLQNSTSCFHDDCRCSICGESFETQFGIMDGLKLGSFYRLWDRPSKQGAIRCPLQRPRSLERTDKYRDCGCYTRAYLKREHSGV